MNRFKNILFQYDTTLTQNVLATPLIGLNTNFDGFMICANKPVRLGFATNRSVTGVANTTTGIRIEPFINYTYAQNTLINVGMFCTESGCNVSVLCFEEDY